MSRGKRWGAPRYGYRTVKGAVKNSLAPDIEEQKVIALMRRLARDDLSYRQICAELEARRIRPRTPGARWHPNTVRRILANDNQL